jgi:hypothetical protein
VEGEKPTPEKGETAPTTPKEEPTLGKTDTQKEPEYDKKKFDAAVGKATSSLQSKVDELTAEAERQKAETAYWKTAHDETDAELQKRLAEDPETLEGYKDKKARNQAWAEIERQKAEVKKMQEAAANEGRMIALAMKAKEVSENTGIPIEELHGLQYAEDMEIKGLQYKLQKAEEAKEAPKSEESEEKFDTAVSTGTGTSWRELSPEGKVQAGLKRK